MENKIRVAITGLGSRGYDTYATIIKVLRRMVSPPLWIPQGKD